MKHFIFLYLLLFTCTISAQNLYDYSVEERIKELGFELSTPAKPVANYVGAIRTGNLIFLSGKISKDKNGELILGKLGKDLTTEQGYEAAKSCGIDILSSLKEEVGDLNKVVRIVKVTGFVNSDPNFVDQSKVVNGFSDLMVEVFGERGKHARAAVGMASLPLGASVEVEMIVEIQP
jgi:enamine deaminase RidA (YjgF/YER057c/UK114 family)